MLELLRMRKPTVVTNEGVRFVKRKNSLGSVLLGIQKAENPFRLERSASCDLALFSLDRDRAHLRSMNTMLSFTTRRIKETSQLRRFLLGNCSSHASTESQSVA